MAEGWAHAGHLAKLTETLRTEVDPHTRAAVASEAYDLWFHDAAAYAKSLPDATAPPTAHGSSALVDISLQVLDVLSGGDQGQVLLGGAEDSVCTALCDAFAKVVGFLRTKPKLSAVCCSAAGAGLIGWLEHVAVARLEGVGLNSHAPSANRAAALRALVPAVQLVGAARPGLRLQCGRLAAAAFAAEEDGNVSRGALEVLRAHGVQDTVHAPPLVTVSDVTHAEDVLPSATAALSREPGPRAMEVLDALAANASPHDVGGGGPLDLFWQLGGLEAGQALDALLHRVEQETVGVDAVSGAGPRTLGAAVLESAACIFRGSEDAANALAADTAAAARTSLVRVLGTCCSAALARATVRGRNLHANPPPGARALPPDYEHPAEALELLDAALMATGGSSRACGPFLEWALDEGACTRGTVLAVGGGAAQIYPADVWASLLLPRLERQLRPVRGAQQHDSDRVSMASGDVEEVALDVIYNCARIWYGGDGASLSVGPHAAERPSAALGKAMLHALLESTRCGHAENGLFPAQAASVVRAHAVHDAHAWVASALSPDVCCHARVTRGVRTLVLTLLGLEEDTPPLRSPAAMPEDMDRWVAAEYGPHRAAARVDGDASADNGGVEAAVGSGADAHGNLAATAADVDAAKVLAVVAAAGTPVAFAILQDLAQRHAHVLCHHVPAVAMAVDTAAAVVRGMAKAGERRASDLAPIEDWLAALASAGPVLRDPNPEGLLALWLQITDLAEHPPADEACAHLVRQFPPGAPPSPAVAVEALRLGADRTRAAVAAFYPTLSLSDPAPAVRIAALHALAGATDIVENHAALILAAMPEGEGDDTGMAAVELATAASPLLGALGACHPPAICVVVPRLATYLRITALNSAMHRPAEAVVAALRRIACEGDAGALAEFVHSTSGRAAAPAISEALPEWRDLADRLPVPGPAGGAALVIAGMPVAVVDAQRAAKGAFATPAGSRPLATTTKPEAMPPASPQATGKPSAEAAVRVLLEAGRRLLAAGDPPAAMRMCARARAASAPAFAAAGGPALVARQVLPELRDRCLPMPTGRRREGGGPAFSPAALSQYDGYAALLREASTLFPAEAEAVLQPAARVADLAAAVVDDLLERGDVHGAREWLERRAVRSGLLAQRVARAERERRGAAAATGRSPGCSHGVASMAAAVATAFGGAPAATCADGRYERISAVDDIPLALPLPPPPHDVPERSPAMVLSRWRQAEPATPRSQMLPVEGDLYQPLLSSVSSEQGAGSAS